MTGNERAELVRLEDAQRVAFQAYEVARNARNAYVAKLAEDGATFQELSTITGLSRQRMWKMAKEAA